MLHPKPLHFLTTLLVILPSAAGQAQGDQATVPVVFEGADVAVGAAEAPVVGEAFTVEGPTQSAAPVVRGVRTPEPESRVYFTPERKPGSTDLWVRGATYKAHAATTGFTYIPFLGSDVPRSFPVSFRLASATLAGEPLGLNPKASISRSGNRIVLDRGAVDVVYDFELEQIEQSFAVDAAGATGDLVLTLDVTSDLEQRADGAGFTFDGPFGGMTYGAATVLDGAGRSAPVVAQLEGEELRLTVDAAFLASAEGMIVVDPVLNTFDVDSSMGEQRNVDVSFDVDALEYLFVYQDTFSGTDSDLFSRVYDTNGVYVRGGYIDAGGSRWRDPSVANVNRDNVYLIVASRVDAGGRGEIVGFTMDAVTYAVSSEILIGDTNNSWSNTRPDVGGNSALMVGAKFLVTWEREFSSTQTLPRMRTVDPDGTMSPVMFVDSGVNVRRTEVVVSESTGRPSMVNIWNVAYRSRDLTTSVESIRGMQFNALGAVIQPPTTLREFPAFDRVYNVDVSDGLAYDGLDPTYLVTYDEQSTSVPDVALLVCRNNVRLRQIDLTVREHADEASNQENTQLGTTWDKFLVTYADYEGSEYLIYATTLDPVETSELAISERRTLLGSAGGITYSGAAIATQASGGNSSRQAGIAWPRRDGVNFDVEIDGASFLANNPPSPAFQYCSSNPNSTGDRGFMRMEGDRSFNTAKTIVCSALPPGQFGLLLSGSSTGFVPNPGGSEGNLCLGGQLGRYNGSISQASADGTVEFAMDPASIPSPTGSFAAMAGQFYQWQLWHRDSLGGAATSNYTNAVTILFR